MSGIDMNDVAASEAAGRSLLLKEQDVLMRVEDLCAYFPVRTGILRRTTSWVRAVDKVSFAIRRGETLGLVGESGCGKTTLGRTILGLRETSGGKIYFLDQNISGLDPRGMKAARRHMQLIFQDPYASLDPRVKVGNAVRSALQIHGIGTRAERDEMVAEIFRRVGLDPSHRSRYPHEFSGGQRQRVGIARALILQPKFVVCDEPVSALDVSIQSQILNLLKDLQEEFSLTYLFISHNLSVIEHVADRVAVMYLGKVVELAPREVLFRDPRHPYTKALISAIPRPDPRQKRNRNSLKGEIPSPTDMPAGCRFQSRCPSVMPSCKVNEPSLVDVGDEHWVSCWLEDPDKLHKERV